VSRLTKIILAPAMLFVFLFFIISCSKEDTGNKSDKLLIPVEVKNVERGNLKRAISLTGDIEPWKVLNVVPDIAGKVTKIYVQEGSRVKRGQLLAELDTEAARLQLEQAKAGLGVAEANYKDAKRNKERMDNLLQQNAVSEQQHEKIKLAYEAAQAQLRQAKEALNLVQYRINVSLMKAPFSGIITGKHINEGETINPMMPGGRGVVTLMDISKVKIKVNIPAKDLRDIRIGLKSLLRVDSYPDEIFEGKVFIINPAADPLTRSFEVQIAAANPDFKLKAGMFARVEIMVEKRENVVVVPIDAILEEGENNYVFITENSKAFKKLVKLGLREGILVEVISGLMENEKVVTVGKEMLKDGSSIAIQGGKAK